ncbi:MAG: nitroreductase family protein [Bacillota bacterium]|nr:nitroreductase family protein [Bacillota bacterium]
MIKINEDRCIECLTCLSVCPFTVLEDVDGRPQLAPGKTCLKCMHCGAICPTEAITFDEKPSILSDELPVPGNDFSKDLKNHILTRRSYRHFNEEPVPRGIIQDALELASWAPSAKNQHPTKWIVIESRELMDQIMELILKYTKETGISPEIASELEAGNNVVMGTAPTLLLAYARDNAISPETDTAIAMTTVELYLQARGVGTCWAGYLKRMANAIPEIRALLPELPENNSFYGAFMIGYPEDEKYLHIPERLKRADIRWA